METKKCLICGSLYQSRIKHQKYCSHECRLKAGRNAYTKVSGNLPTGTVGALSELLTSVDLLLKGYEVFRAISPACSCDLAVLKNHKLLRVEVRTGFYRGTKLCVNTASIGGSKYDILAIVDLVKNQIIYRGTFD